jgi:endoglucanase
VRPEHLSSRFADAGAIERRLAAIERAVATLLRLGFAVSLDLHPGAAFNRLHRDEPQAGFAVLLELWPKLAARFARAPAERVFFEVLNEPNVPAEVWASQGPSLAAAIRRAAPEHTLIYGPANFQRIDALERLTPLSDRNVVYAVHYYDPMSFTHQGMTWSREPIAFLKGVPFPAALADLEPQIERLGAEGHALSVAALVKDFREPWTGARIDAAFARAAQWGAPPRRPGIVNGVGVQSVAAPAAARVAWVRAGRKAAERHCIGWAHWDYADGFGFVARRGGTEAIDAGVADALVEPTR